MLLESVISYNTNSETHQEIGYHTTYNIFKDEIVKNGFTPSTEEDDWLGEGVYFWDNICNAHWWKSTNNANNNGVKIQRCIFKCLLSCSIRSYLNLDNPLDMKRFEDFCKKYNSELRKNAKKRPVFDTDSKKRKFYCDIYCITNNIKILSFTFHKIRNNNMGFPVDTNRRQICVKDSRCITINDIEEIKE